MGPPVDLEPPVLKITGILLPDGTEILIEEDNKLFIGPGILFGPGFFLKGEARDNVLVTEIIVEEIGHNAEIIDGKFPTWRDASIGARNINGFQQWSISLDGITRGERTIRITALDNPGNIGPETIKHLTLLVDTDHPFVESERIERRPGLNVDLLTKTRLREMDPNQFEYIDYFQNEDFTIRASITHDFGLSAVSMNLIDESGMPVFSEDLQPTGGSLYTPSWYITAEQLIAANPEYAAGRHYFNISITAKAEAGHSNEDATNFLLNLCWYPEADIPRIQVALDDIDGFYVTEKSGVLPLRFFDDDNISEIYAAVVKADFWDNLPGSDNAKLQAFYNTSDRNNFIYDGAYPLRENLLDSATRHVVIPIMSGNERGEYRLIIVARDLKDDGSGVWANSIFTVFVTEDGIPLITIESPDRNTSPALTDGSFKLTGSVINLDEVNVLKIAWVPAGRGWNTDQQVTNAREALQTEDDSGKYVRTNGIVVWNLELTQQPDRIIGGRNYNEYKFDKDFNIFTDFMFNNEIENNEKFFMLYTHGGGENTEVFESFRLLAYTDPPNINVRRPDLREHFGQDEEIHFIISADSPLGVPIKNMTLSLDGGSDIELTRGEDSNINIWEGFDSHSVTREYNYIIRATDLLGNYLEIEHIIVVETPPDIQRIVTPHAANTTFAVGEIIILQAVFDKSVHNVVTTDGTPRLVLGGFEDGVDRYAYYTGGVGSTTLNFNYTVKPDDKTTTDGITVKSLDLNGGRISANFNDFSSIQNLEDKTINIDAIPPRITSIVVSGNGGDWLRQGHEITIEVTIDKPIWVKGNPRLILPINKTAARTANFQNTNNDDTTIIFSYIVQAGDEADPVTINSSNCFTETHRLIITDKVGVNGNPLYLNAGIDTTGTVRVDAVPPLRLQLLKRLYLLREGTFKLVRQEWKMTEQGLNIPFTDSHGKQ